MLRAQGLIMSTTRRVFAMVVSLAALGTVVRDVALAPAEAQGGTAILVDAAVNRRLIDPRVYGVNWADAAQLAALNVPVHRWGGNATTRHNWKTNGDNRGGDWYFESIPGSGAQGAAFDDFVQQAKQNGSEPMLTIPLIGWVGKNGPGGTKLASFSAAKYGAQQDCDWTWFPDACNGVLTNGSYVTGNDPNDANVPSNAQYQKEWVQHLVSRWGAAANGGVRYYIYDNEPSLWHDTHRDVHPAGQTMSELRDLMIAYGTAIRQADPGAVFVGPEEWGWLGYFLSGYDQKYGNETGCWSCAPDKTANGGMDFMPWLLAQMRQHEQSTGSRLLHVFTLHYYPQGGESGDDTSTAMQQRRNRSTRSLWDPNYTDETWIGDRVRLVPRMKEWVNAHYPGLETGITEYSWGADSHINGATTQADVLGIFGREGLNVGTRWVVPATNTPTFKAIQMYRNYDGNKSVFGDTSVKVTVPNSDSLSAFAAERSSDGALTVMAINKVTTSVLVNLSLANFTPGPTAQVWRLTSTNTIQRLTDATVTGGMSVTLPAQSITLFVVPRSAGAPLGRSNLLWHHQGTGSLYVWFMNGAAQAGGAYLSPAGVSNTQWQVRGTADFTGDGQNDLLWHHQGTGELYVWTMNGATQTGGAYLSPARVDTQWQVRGLADFSGDGRTDVLWQHQGAGDLYLWTMNGTTQTGGAYLSPARVSDTQWRVVGVGDFNGDGKADLVWHHQGTGDVYVWFMNGTVQTGGASLGRVPSLQWQIRQVGDFNADGMSDILWHHQTAGTLYVWYLNGTARAGESYLSPSAVPDTSWKVAQR